MTFLIFIGGGAGALCAPAPNPPLFSAVIPNEVRNLIKKEECFLVSYMT
ncbi:MAG: hypothetical protein HY063_11440 [Bacteroidetes bacterium]|nr:hypothetical protein [Bacteroidota bacterium]